MTARPLIGRKPQLGTPNLDRFALLAMTESGRQPPPLIRSARRAAWTVIASDSEAIQTEPQFESPSLGRFALLAMTERGRHPPPLMRSARRARWNLISWSSETAITITAPVTKVLQVASMPKKIRPLLMT